MRNNIFNFFKALFVRLFTNYEIDYDTWLFSSSFNTKFNYNSKYFFEYVLEKNSSVTPIFVINDDKLRVNLGKTYGDHHFIETKSTEGIKKALSAGVWLTSAGLPLYGTSFKNKRLIINLWHGIPLKKIALLEEDISLIKRIYFKQIFSKNYSYIVTTSKKLIKIMKHSFGVTSDQIKVLGQPRNDTIYKNNKKDKIISNLYNEIPNYKHLILYAPTFRDSSNTKFFPFEDFDNEQLHNFLEKEKIIIFIRAHQSESTRLVNQNYGDRVHFINDDVVDDIMTVINIFDLLITDYSSIYLDYLLTNNPILFLPYDRETYFKERGFNFNYDSVTPGPKPDNFNDFKNEILKLIKNRDYYAQERNYTNSYFNEIKKKSSEKVFKFIKNELKKYSKT